MIDIFSIDDSMERNDELASCKARVIRIAVDKRMDDESGTCIHVRKYQHLTPKTFLVSLL